MLRGLYCQGCHEPVIPIVGTRIPRGILQERQVVNRHDLMANQDRTQAREAEYKIVLLANEEKRKHTLFPEMGVANAVMNDGQVAYVVVLMDRRLRTYDGEGLTKACHSLADIVGIALDTRHGLCQEPSVDIYCHGSLF